MPNLRGFSKLHVSEYAHTECGRQCFALDQELRFQLPLAGFGTLDITVPRGFVTDFASVPCFLWWLVPPAGPWMRAAVVHDYLCLSRACPRFLADAIFRVGMQLLGVPCYRRVPMYYACRAYALTALPIRRGLAAAWRKRRGRQ